MKELSPEARAILDAAAPLDDPSPDDRARVKKAVMSAVTVGTAAATTGVASSAAAATASAGGGAALAGGATIAGVSSVGVVAAKAVAALAVVGATVGVVVTRPWAGSGEREEPSVAAPESEVDAPVEASGPGVGASRAPSRPAGPTVAVELTEVEPAAAVEPTEIAPNEAIEPAATLPPRAQRALHAPAPRPRAAVHRSGAARPTTPAQRASTEIGEAAQAGVSLEADPLAVELALLRRARRALADGDTSAALVALREHQERFPDGALAAEREGTRALVLCARGGSSEPARVFLRDYPRSPLAARVRAACGL